MTLQTIYGQDDLRIYLQNTAQNKNPSHAYLMYGERGSGKELAAGLFACGLQCEAASGDIPCNQCPSCKRAASGSHPDILYVAHEKPGTISVDDIRASINDDIAILPYYSKFKIYIILDAQNMTVQAQNALLKTLEEPPSYAVIILVATDLNELLPTIISRCVLLHRKPLDEATIMDYLTKELGVTPYRAKVCASFARGNIGKAKRLAANDDFEQIMREVIAALRSIEKMDLGEISAAVKKINDYRIDTDDYLDILMTWYRDALVYKATTDCNQLLFKDELMTITHITNMCSYEGLENILNALNKTKRRLQANANFETTLELLFMTIRDCLNGN